MEHTRASSQYVGLAPIPVGRWPLRPVAVYVPDWALIEPGDLDWPVHRPPPRVRPEHSFLLRLAGRRHMSVPS